MNLFQGLQYLGIVCEYALDDNGRWKGYPQFSQFYVVFSKS